MHGWTSSCKENCKSVWTVVLIGGLPGRQFKRYYTFNQHAQQEDLLMPVMAMQFVQLTLIGSFHQSTDSLATLQDMPQQQTAMSLHVLFPFQFTVCTQHAITKYAVCSCWLCFFVLFVLFAWRAVLVLSIVYTSHWRFWLIDCYLCWQYTTLCLQECNQLNSSSFVPAGCGQNSAIYRYTQAVGMMQHQSKHKCGRPQLSPTLVRLQHVCVYMLVGCCHFLS